MNLKDINALSAKIIGLAIEVHKTLKSGFAEKIYQQALGKELEKK